MKTKRNPVLPTSTAREYVWLLGGVLAVTAAVTLAKIYNEDVIVNGELSTSEGLDIGSNTSIPVDGIAAGLGHATSAGGIRSVVAGYDHSTNNASDSAVFGQTNALGSSADISFAAGKGNTLHRMTSAVLGAYNEVHGEGGKAIGYDLVGRSAHSLVVGIWNEEPDSGYSSTAYTGTDADHLFVVGAGTSDTARKNALVVTQSGKVLLPEAQGDISMGIYGN